MADSLSAPGAAIGSRGAPESTRPLAARLLAAILCLSSGAAGLSLALQYPIGPPLAAAGVFAAVAVWAALWPGAWILALPAVLVLVGFAPWTGWLTFEE